VSSGETPKTDDVPKRRKRGRPPKIDTPEEARIRSILRAIRKVKDEDGRQLFTEFEKLPDQEQYPDYYNEIKKPIALDQITVHPDAGRETY
jgi:chromatin structure-remodeling complex subunit RSC1/2